MPSFTREELTPEWVEETVRRIRAEGSYEPLTHEQRAETLRVTLAALGEGEDPWVFGFGSLMWNPMVKFSEQRLGLLHGYRRRYCFRARSGRASPERPGYGLGLVRGGCCYGMVFRVPAIEAQAEFELLWRREMIGGTYRPRWVPVRTREGLVRAVAFTADSAHARFVSELSVEQVAALLARAEGRRGTAREYLENTVAYLASQGAPDRYLFRLHDLVRRESAQSPS